MYHLVIGLSAVVDMQGGQASLDRLLACEQVADARRLACYDEQVRAIRQQRSQVARALGSPKEAKFSFKPIDSTIKAVSSLRPGFWRVALADGSAWQNSEWTGATPSVGRAMTVRKGALSSLWATTEAIGSVKVRRVLAR